MIQIFIHPSKRLLLNATGDFRTQRQDQEACGVLVSTFKVSNGSLCRILQTLELLLYQHGLTLLLSNLLLQLFERVSQGCNFLGEELELACNQSTKLALKANRKLLRPLPLNA